MTDLPLIDGRQPFILECNGRFCVMHDAGSGQRLFLNAAGEWHVPWGVDKIHRLKSRESAEDFVMECAANETK